MRIRPLCSQSENDLQAKLQIKQRELLELKKRKLELELAATQKQLGLTTVSMDSKPSAVIPDALTKPPHTMMLPINPPSKISINQIGHGVATTMVRILCKHPIPMLIFNSPVEYYLRL